MAENLESYENSISRKHIDHISDYLGSSSVGDNLQKATSDLIIIFASNETGESVSKRLSDQRKYLKEQFDKYKQNEIERIGFVKNISDVVDFLKYSWNFQGAPSFETLGPDSISDNAKLCLSFLSKIKHTITLGPITRFYSEALLARPADRSKKIMDLDGAIKAITAFSILWRASRRGTKNIDTQYREIMLGLNDKTTLAPALSRKPKYPGSTRVDPKVDLDLLKSELKARLKHKSYGDIFSKEDFVEQGFSIPHYINNKDISRILLLAAYNDSIVDIENKGLITKGKVGSLSCLTYDGFTSKSSFTLEHIAPQNAEVGWSSELYVNREFIHTLGNLVLVPLDANASLSNRPWNIKKIMYRALGSASQQEAQRILDAAQARGIEFGDVPQSIILTSRVLPQLVSLGEVNQDWDAKLIESRSKRILELAYDTLHTWLN